MKSSTLFLGVVCVVLLALTTSAAKSEPALEEPTSNFLDQLQVGMQVRIEGDSGQFAIYIAQMDDLKDGGGDRYEYTVKEVRRDCLVVTAKKRRERVLERTLPLHSIREISTFVVAPDDE